MDWDGAAHPLHPPPPKLEPNPCFWRRRLPIGKTYIGREGAATVPRVPTGGDVATLGVFANPCRKVKLKGRYIDTPPKQKRERPGARAAEPVGGLSQNGRGGGAGGGGIRSDFVSANPVGVMSSTAFRLRFCVVLGGVSRGAAFFPKSAHACNSFPRPSQVDFPKWRAHSPHGAQERVAPDGDFIRPPIFRGASLMLGDFELLQLCNVFTHTPLYETK